MLAKNTHPADVVARLKKAGTNMRTIAGALEMHPTSFSHCLRRPIPRANQAIAEALGDTPHGIWPRWYDREGNRLPSPDLNHTAASNNGESTAPRREHKRNAA